MDLTEKRDYLEQYNDSDEYGDLLFYTSKTIQLIDDIDILEKIYISFPKLKEAKEEKEERKAFVEFLQQRKLVNEILSKYNLSIIDLIKLFYRKAAYIFNTANYSNKIKEIIEANGYPTEV